MGDPVRRTPDTARASHALIVRSVLSVLGLVLVLVLVIPVSSGAAEPPAGALAEAQLRLVEHTREYRESLARVLAFRERDAARAGAQVANRRELLGRGLVARRELEESELALMAARDRVEETQRRMAEADALMGETLAAIELAKMPKAADMETVITSAVIRYRGSVDLTAVTVSGLERFFSTRFGRALPVSARGQTIVHDRLGLDHRHALDVAIHPDSAAGRVLIEYLRGEQIPFLAFRGPIPGSSTGAHLHVGQTSAPLVVPAKATAR